ncbi:hypothetical protein [Fluviicola sp.]|jgi:hypothetical protein|uniref:hypothetical protein n=1 Tax=Fluviicola sp. TaxID=1917219 RepID=UPI002830B381|nr:hypothetical protein [Fluviicola sp.]MDR0801052.1 hypothetical protein [Fluviicola sp.]
MLEFLQRNIRKITILLIAGAFALQFSGKIQKVASGDSTCVCAYDGYGYYMYLTQLFQYRNLGFQQQELQEVQNKYCEGTVVYQLKRQDNGNNLDIYHMGQAYLELPAYTVGHVFAKAFGYPKDGFSKPYHITYLLNALFFILLGLFFLTKILRLFFSDQLSALLLLIIYFGTNFWVTAIHSYQLQHIYLFALIGLLLYALLKLRAFPAKRKYLVIAALILGLISAVRPTHVLLGFLPLFLLRGIYPSKATYWKSLLLFPLAGLLFNLPQIIYWKILGGSWFILNMHVEEVVIVDPHLVDFLFSYKKGWLLYSPVFLLLIPGLIQVYKKQRTLFWGIFTTTTACIWIFASWECWWYAASFGSRAMVDLYPLLAVPLGFALIYLGKKKIVAIATMVFLVFTTGLSLFQSEQFARGYLHPDRMTKAQYWYIFGKLNMPYYQANRLEIDRGNLNWPDEFLETKVDFAHVEKRIFCEILQTRAAGKKSTLIDKQAFFPALKTDETLFDIQVIYQNNDSLNPGNIYFETFSKYNVYNWQAGVLSSKKKAGSTDTLHVRFNLPVINHQDDKMQIYVVNPSEKEIIIRSVKITAFSLIRR